MLQRKDKNIIKQMIREAMVEQLNKSSFKAGYKPVTSETTETKEGGKENV